MALDLSIHHHLYYYFKSYCYCCCYSQSIPWLAFSSPCWEGLWAVCASATMAQKNTIRLDLFAEAEQKLYCWDTIEQQQKTGLACPTQRASAHVQGQSKSKERHSWIHSGDLGKWRAPSLSISQCGGCTGSMEGFRISLLESPVTGGTRFSLLFNDRTNSSSAPIHCWRGNKKLNR